MRAARACSRTSVSRACSCSIHSRTQVATDLVGKLARRGSPSLVKNRLKTPSASARPARAASRLACSFSPLGRSVFSDPCARAAAARP